MGFTWKVLVWFRRKAKVLIDSYFYNKAENPSLTDAWLTLTSEGLVTSKAKLSFHKYIPSGEWERLTTKAHTSENEMMVYVTDLKTPLRNPVSL